MICCICGERFEDDALVIRLMTYRLRLEEVNFPYNYTLLASQFEDGTSEKLAHLLCPIEFGAPMSLIGADGTRTDV